MEVFRKQQTRTYQNRRLDISTYTPGPLRCRDNGVWLYIILSVLSNVPKRWYLVNQSNPRKINPFKVLIGILPGPNPGVSEEKSSTRKYSEKKILPEINPGNILRPSGDWFRVYYCFIIVVRSSLKLKENCDELKKSLSVIVHLIDFH